MQIGPGAELAGFLLEEQIGEGGMGVVYRARQIDLDRSVALKLIGAERREDSEFTERFQRESRLAASIDHPNVVPIFQAGTEDGVHFIAMRFVAGRDLGQLLSEEGPLDPNRAARIVAEVGAGLDAAHAAGLVHRDVKPANVLLDSNEHVYLTDFGLTKQVSSQTSLTRTGVWYGALPYSAPEQIESRPQDARTDVYGLGCILFEALSGKQPYERDNEMAVMWAKVHEDAPPVSEAAPAVPQGFNAILKRALARDPDQRYLSAGDLGRAAAAAASGRPNPEPERTVARGEAAAPTAVLDGPEPATRQIIRPDARTRVLSGDRSRRRWLLVALGTVAVAVLGGLAAFALSSGGGNDGEPSVRTVTESVPQADVESPAGNEDVAQASTIEPPPLERFQGARYNAEIPVGWPAEQLEEKVSGRWESKWVNPEDEETWVLIDSQIAEYGTAPIENAEGVRSEASNSPDYEEISFGPISLDPYGPADDARWVFEVEGLRKVDYFFEGCGIDFAVLGASSPADFGAWASTFHEVAHSVEPRYCE